MMDRLHSDPPTYSVSHSVSGSYLQVADRQYEPAAQKTGNSCAEPSGEVKPASSP